MITRTIRIGLATAALALALASPGFAQLSDNLSYLSAENVKGYLQPLPKALSATMNTAEFQSASIPFAGFNLTVGVHVMGATFADKDRTFTPVDPLGLGFTGQAPTVIGGTQAGALTRSDHTAQMFPGGFDLSQFELAVPQIGIGSIMGTRAIVRWIQFDGGGTDLGKVKLLGIGLQHSLSHYIKKPLPFDLAVGAMYQTFQLGNNKLIDVKAFHGEVTASKKMKLWVQPYVGLGYDTFSMETNYDYKPAGGGTESLHVKFDNENSFHGTAGILLGLPAVKLFAQVDAAAEMGAALGLRFGMGN